MVPYDRISELFNDLFDRPVGKGTLVGMVESCHTGLEGFEGVLKGLLKGVGVLYTDETGFRVCGKRQWIHVLCTRYLTWYGHHKHRGSGATIEQGILPVFKGVLVHDFWKPYFKYGCGHVLCNAHLLRELRGVSEAFGQEWGWGMSGLLHEVKARVDAARASSQPLDGKAIADYESRYTELIGLGLWENTGEPERVGKRGPGTQSKRECKFFC
ncbi:IS66 family transposase [Methanocella paludicola]|uniref:IS66 family transposase n=1 Tax=Methanocella paludicola TaxID=570267 RepID=UPI001E4DEDF9|nr:IS66 family transposase [Methanocella paludicola]